MVRQITPIRVFDRNFNLLAEIDNYESLQFSRSFYGIGDFELRINANKLHAEKIEKNTFIMVGRHVNKVGIVKDRSVSLDSGGHGSETWIIQGPTLKGITSQRVTVPVRGRSHDNTFDNAESALWHYMYTQVTNTEDPKRKIPEVVLDSRRYRGERVDRISRFRKLDEELEEIAMLGNVGWDIHYLPDKKQWFFTTMVGEDRTINQSARPPVVFSPEFNNVKSQEFSESELNYKNAAYVAGDGEGTDRRILEIGSGSGFERSELFIDARDIQPDIGEDTVLSDAEVNNLLIKRGNGKLAEHGQEVYFESEILVPEMVTNNMQYEKDWDLGDTVTTQNRKWGVTMNSQITQTTEVYEAGGFQLSVVFGQSKPTIFKVLNQRINQIQPELTR
ncbi:MAG: siphovirus ReqiPepy6 Gp37-like family protein [Bacillus sp. (in: firmicutes)]